MAAVGRMSRNDPPPLPEELAKICTRMRLPYLRKAARDVLATARAQRWDPAEVVRVLLQEEVVGRAAATRRMRRKTANFSTGKNVFVLAAGGVVHSPGPPPQQHASTHVAALPSPRVVLSRRLNRYYGRLRLPSDRPPISQDHWL